MMYVPIDQLRMGCADGISFGRKKMLKYMQIQTRVGEHNATLDSLDGKLRDAREMLVKQTGALVATAATHGHEGHNAQRD